MGELEIRGDIEGQASELRGQLVALTPASQSLSKQLEEAEMTQRELLRQVGALAERISSLKEQQAQQRLTEERVRAELSRTEAQLSEKLASEGQSQQHLDAERALTAAAAELAGSRADIMEAPDGRTAELR